MKHTKKYLELENKWLWYHHEYAEDNARFIEVTQYNKKGEVIACSSSYLPNKKDRPKHPKELGIVK